MAEASDERRFLVSEPHAVVGTHLPLVISQAYLFMEGGWCIQVRRTYQAAGTRAASGGHNTLAVKGPRTGRPRVLHETEIAAEVAENLYRLAKYKVVKERFSIIMDGAAWELDVFHHDNEGLVIAECTSAPSPPPTWCAGEVTGDHRYDNEELARRPFSTWG